MTGLAFELTDVSLADGSTTPRGGFRFALAGKEGMRINEHVIDAVTVLGLIGDLDARSAPLAQSRLSASLPTDGPVLLDLTEVQYVSSAGLRTMLMVYRQAQRVGTPIALVGLSASLHRIMSSTGFLRFFDVADTITDGIAVLTNARQAADQSVTS